MTDEWLSILIAATTNNLCNMMGALKVEHALPRASPLRNIDDAALDTLGCL